MGGPPLLGAPTVDRLDTPRTGDVTATGAAWSKRCAKAASKLGPGHVRACWQVRLRGPQGGSGRLPRAVAAPGAVIDERGLGGTEGSARPPAACRARPGTTTGDVFLEPPGAACPGTLTPGGLSVPTGDAGRPRPRKNRKRRKLDDSERVSQLNVGSSPAGCASRSTCWARP